MEGKPVLLGPAPVKVANRTLRAEGEGRVGAVTLGRAGDEQVYRKIEGRHRRCGNAGSIQRGTSSRALEVGRDGQHARPDGRAVGGRWLLA